MYTLRIFLFLSFISTLLFAQNPLDQILDERARASLTDEILQDRMENLLPRLMDQAGLDMWILISREYNEDPVMKTMLPATWLSARRRTIMVFFKKEDGLEKLP